MYNKILRMSKSFSTLSKPLHGIMTDGIPGPSRVYSSCPYITQRNGITNSGSQLVVSSLKERKQLKQLTFEHKVR